jgi:membrane-associated protease RseP (regulator of RpoE activity)
MKRTTLLVLIATWLTAVPACAQTTPAPVTPPTPPNPPVAPKPPPPPAPTRAPAAVRDDPFAPGNQFVIREFAPAMEKGNYLGVTTSPVPAVLRDQLRLRPGLGLVVDFVRPDSPAAAAGLRQNDILEKIDDQLLVSNQQLAILVRMHKAGDEVKLSVIREAKPQSITVTLTEADVVPLEQLSRGGDMKAYDSALKLLHSAQSMPAKTIPGGAFGGGGGWQNMPAKTWASDQNATYGIVWSDKEHTFEISQDKEKERHLVAKDKSGKVIFDGPIANDEQIEKLPPEIREKVKKIKVIRLEPPQSTTSPAFRNTLKSSSKGSPTPAPAPMPGI